ncbi:FAD-dependent oxidoreductase [Planomonospora sp. ID67723]|uniref:FAD-binding oxidoreductase n=1 Tax=Planomonospora sp. ID67723 TaxID=2738134 RepID=UPI0018C38707|nr:FAD-dependent oxidoreductase [Planomonospora sp. ID67723]MBG0829109.1 FAD-dependent oxidoreductase [Planomonospora sp. ID67723]
MRVARPGEPGYDAATAVFSLAAIPEPAAAAVVRTVEEVRQAIRFARREGLPVRVHTTGHSAPAARPMREALLLRTEMTGTVEIDSDRRVARVPAGTRWGAVVKAAAEHGLSVAHGSSPTVGVVGYLLGGGLSFYGRHVGLAANSVRAVELVTADGELRRADADLLWALRGGGGGFGVVTAVEVGLFPVAQVVTGAACWPARHAPELLRAWRAWTLDAPDEATTTVRILNLPDLPDVPPMLSAGPVLCVDGAVLAGTDDDVPTALAQADDLLGPLRDIAEPVLDTWQTTAPAGLLDTHMDPSDPVEVIGDHLLLDELGDAGIEALLKVIGAGSGSPLIAAGLRQLGGAYGRPDPSGGALNALNARYAYSGGGVPGLSGTREQIIGRLPVVRAALAPWDTGRTAPTFVERFDQPQGHLDAATVTAVDAVRARVDPDGLFRDDIMPGATHRTASS